MLRTLSYAVRHRIERRLPLVTAPVLVLRGEHDPIAPSGWARRAAELARTGTARDIPGAAHNAMTTAGPLVAAQALSFTRGLAGRQAGARGGGC